MVDLYPTAMTGKRVNSSMRSKPLGSRQNHLLIRLWMSRFFNANGTGIGQFAIRWMATSFPSPAIALAYTNTFSSVSQVFSNYIVGWLADNFSPVTLMIGGNMLGALFVVTLGLLIIHLHSLLLLVILVILWTAFSATSNAASAKLIPQLAAPEDLPRVNSWMGSIPPLQQFLASGLAGILVAAGVAHAFLAAALAMAVSSLSMITKRRKWPVSERRQIQPRSIGVGIQTVATDPTLRRMVTFVSVLNFGFSFYLGEYLLYVRNTEHLSAMAIGFGLTFSTSGTALALAIGPTVLKRQIALTVMLTPLIMALGIIVVTFYPGIYGFVIGAVIIEVGSGISNQYVSLIRQRSVPIGKMGSVAGALWMFQSVLVPLGMVLAGVVATHWGAKLALNISGGLVLLSLFPSIPLAKMVNVRFYSDSVTKENKSSTDNIGENEPLSKPSASET